MPIELVVEDGANRSVGERADHDGTGGGRFEPRNTERGRQAENAEAGPEGLFGMRPMLQDQVAQGRRCRSDEGCIPADTGNGPVGVAAMAGPLDR